MEKHTDDLRNVNEGDSVTLHTTHDENLDVKCTLRETQFADERTREVRETTFWEFSYSDSLTLAATITDGLRSSESDSNFPIYSELWDIEANLGFGYIESVEIHGPKLEA